MAEEIIYLGIVVQNRRNCFEAEVERKLDLGKMRLKGRERDSASTLFSVCAFYVQL